MFGWSTVVFYAERIEALAKEVLIGTNSRLDRRMAQRALDLEVPDLFGDALLLAERPFQVPGALQ